MSVLSKLAGQTVGVAALPAMLQACATQPSDAIIGKWDLHNADRKRGTIEFFADGRCTGHSVGSWGPPDTADYVVVYDSIHFTNDHPPHSYLIVFESKDRFTLQPQRNQLPEWYERVDE